MSAGVMGGLAAAQTVIGGYQAYRQGKAQAEAYNANAEQNALNIRYQTETAARNYMQQASDMNFYAKQAKKQGKNAFRMSLLSGAANGVAAAYNAAQPVDAEGQKEFSWLFGG